MQAKKLPDIALLAPLSSNQCADSNSHNRHVVQKAMIVTSSVELFECWAETVLLGRFLIGLSSPASSRTPAR
jgi:hypothetical protein